MQRAVARYEIVIDNYRGGKYPKRERFGDEFFKTQGGLMGAFASVGELSEEIAAGLAYRARRGIAGHRPFVAGAARAL